MIERLTMNITEHFTFAEFEASDTAKKYGIVNIICDFDVRDSIMALVRNVLQPLRYALKKPGHVNSGYRCPELNEKVGGVPTSQHTKGEAADMVFGDLTPYQIAKKALELKLPFDQMILYPDFVHFSHKMKGPNRGQVLYSRTYKGKRL